MEFNNRGILFPNLRKRQPKHPDLTGEATIDGRRYKLAAWRKQGRKGEFFSMAFTAEQDNQPAPQTDVPQSDSPANQSDGDYAF